MPPLNSPPLIALPTLTLMIAITFLMQSSAIFFNSFMVKEYKGVMTAFFATLSLSLSFAAILLREVFPALLVGLISNILTITGHVLIYLAICRFIGNPPQ